MTQEMSERDSLMAVIEKRLEGTTGTTNSTLNIQLINQAAAALWIPKGTTAKERADLVVGAVALLKGIKPTDEIEGLLATQMVATHSAAMECLRRAMIQDQSFEHRDQNLRHASKLMSIYARQIDALNKHRGKGQQKVTVEHVHVEAGAQAVVGSVHTSTAGPTNKANSAPALEHNPGEVLQPVKPTERVKTRNSGKRRGHTA